VRLFPRTARHRLVTAASATVLAIGAVSVPLAHADDLDDRRDRVEERIEHADHALEESSQRTRAAAARLAAAQQNLAAARAELARTREQLAAARELDRQMQLKLERAQARLAQAQLELATGRADLAEQREAVTELVTTMYQDGDPQLQAFASVLSAQDTADLTWVEEGRHVVVEQQTRAYDELRASEVLLEVRKQQVAAAEREVEIQRQEAAEHLVETQALTEQARAVKARVSETVAERRAATREARAARRSDLRDLRELRAQERRIKEMILARARRAARAAARQGGGYEGATGGLLDRPVPGIVTSPFGYRTHPIYGYYSLHNGTDFRAYCGTPLRAVSGGRVLSRYYSSVYGNRLYLNVGVVNGKNVTVVYNHASGYNVGVGQTVSRGQVIGYSGNSGWSTACHLHFTVLVNGRPVNPMNWM
jgi:murein DD-endopeptidase MepM/ murein hydrolase activator NlpD